MFHRYGDYEHRQRNRMKFMVKPLGWETFRARVMEELDGFVAEGGAPLRLTADAMRPQERARLGAGAGAVGGRRGRGRGDAGHRPRHHARLGEAADRCRIPTCAGAQTNVAPQKQAGYHHVTVRLPLGDITAGQMRVLADLAEAYGDGTMRLTVEQNMLFGG